MDTFILGITLFTMIVLTLVSIIIFARSKLVSSGNVNITINGEKKVTVPAGGKLLQTLAAEKLSSQPLPREEGVRCCSPPDDHFFICHVLTIVTCYKGSGKLLLKVSNHLVIIQKWQSP